MRNIFCCLGAAVFLLAFTGIAHAESFTTTPSGLQYKDLKVGAGPVVQPGSTVVIHLSGWVDENGQRGREIYRTRKEGKPVSFVVGTDRVIPAWNEGVVGMQAGGTRMLLVPPQLGFGDRAVEDVIPSNAHLRFVIELLEIR